MPHFFFSTTYTCTHEHRRINLWNKEFESGNGNRIAIFGFFEIRIGHDSVALVPKDAQKDVTQLL
jgi:hypothetical protein